MEGGIEEMDKEIFHEAQGKMQVWQTKAVI